VGLFYTPGPKGSPLGAPPQTPVQDSHYITHAHTLPNPKYAAAHNNNSSKTAYDELTYLSRQ